MITGTVLISGTGCNMSDLYGDLLAEEYLGLTDKVKVHGYNLTALRSSEPIFLKQSIVEDLVLDNEKGELLYDVKTKALGRDRYKMIGKVFGTMDPRVYELTVETGSARFLLVNGTRAQIHSMKVHLSSVIIKEKQ